MNPWGNVANPASVGSGCVGPSLSFAKALADSLPGLAVGIVNIAMSGTNIEVWSKGSPCFLFGYAATTAEAQRAATTYTSSDANFAIAGHIDQVKKAAQDGTISGILWHQGEANCGDGQYGQKFATLIRDWRDPLHMPNLPVVAGHVGTRASDCACNAGIDWAAGTLANVGVASSDGLTQDGAHYDNASQHTFGKRYCAQYLKLARATTGVATRGRAAPGGTIAVVNGQFVRSAITGGTLRITSASGALVRELRWGGGATHLAWDGLDRADARAAAGLHGQHFRQTPIAASSRTPGALLHG